MAREEVLPISAAKLERAGGFTTRGRRPLEAHINSKRATERAFDAVDRARTPARRDSRPEVVRLPEGVAVIEYVISDGKLLIYCVARDAVSLRSVDVTSEQLHETVTRFEASVLRRESIAGLMENASAAYELLIAPVSQLVAGATTIIFVGDRFLQALPFGALYDKRHARFLIEDYAVAISPSAHLLESLAERERDAPTYDVLVIANPRTTRALPALPHGEGEATDVAKLYRRRSVAIGTDATRERFLREWDVATVVHYAGHASSIGEQAALLLGGERGRDYLDDDELDTTPATRLVVLAACETVPLAAAFLVAGVPTVVGTLWPIEDDTARPFFVGFHEQIASGATTGEALRRTQLDLLASADASVRHPASWAGVTVVGVPWLASTE